MAILRAQNEKNPVVIAKKIFLPLPLGKSEFIEVCNFISKPRSLIAFSISLILS